MIVEIGACAAPAKKPAMPTMAKICGCGTSCGHMLCSSNPTAAPVQPPITIEGPNTPPDPPELIVREVVKILTSANDDNSHTPKAAGSVRAVCRTPYPVPSTASERMSPPCDQYRAKPMTPVAAAPRTGRSNGGRGDALKTRCVP